MVFNENFKIIIIMIILITIEIHCFALDQFIGNSFNFKNRFKSLENDMDTQETDINEKDQYVFENQNLESYKRQDSITNNDQDDENSSQNFDFDYKDPIYDYETKIIPSKINGQINRRQVAYNGIYSKNLLNSSMYPSVLTKAVEVSLSPPSHVIPGGNMLGNIAQKMNASTIDLAEKIVNSQNSRNSDQFGKAVQNYIKSNAPFSPTSSAINQPYKQYIQKNVQPNLEPVFTSNEQYKETEHIDNISASSIASVLDRVLSKLDSIQNAKNNENDHPDGAPCDVVGSWSSSKLGFCFDIIILNDNLRYISPAEINNKILSITATECIPIKRHYYIDLDWKFTGSTIKQMGGPFYIYGQKRSENLAATFLGFCRTCGGIDTIFGSWNFLSPSTDCNDISLSNDVRQDVLRRVRMEIKRKERIKNLLYENRHGY